MHVRDKAHDGISPSTPTQQNLKHITGEMTKDAKISKPARVVIGGVSKKKLTSKRSRTSKHINETNKTGSGKQKKRNNQTSKPDKTNKTNI